MTQTTIIRKLRNGNVVREIGTDHRGRSLYELKQNTKTYKLVEVNEGDHHRLWTVDRFDGTPLFPLDDDHQFVFETQCNESRVKQFVTLLTSILFR